MTGLCEVTVNENVYGCKFGMMAIVEMSKGGELRTETIDIPELVYFGIKNYNYINDLIDNLPSKKDIRLAIDEGDIDINYVMTVFTESKALSKLIDTNTDKKKEVKKKQ